MSDISGATYVVLGLIVAVVSVIVTIAGRKFYLFMAAGAIMVIIGFLKLSSKKQKKNIKKPKCPKCSSIVRNNFNYCYNCGNKLR